MVRVLTLVVAIIAGAAPVGTANKGDWRPCTAHVRDFHRIAVSNLSCARAKRAIKRGHLVLTPAEPLFETARYRCRPAGDGIRMSPSYPFVCRSGARAFRFAWL